ncbi:Poly [ADP-ribose] polymerase 2 [Cucurbita argyrosperma subsp. argyrosperma]|nr:Poly [ADP-ribose] polymerase 2 [Cucurbita argyrosperma subsp. argyrosperma]
MANKLRVDELRTQLAQRGLDTSGTKPALVLRLESAIRDEEKSLKGKDAAATDRKKRGRDSEDARNSDGSDLIRDVEKLREMNAQQLRDEAVRRGIASTGSKKELLKRICDDCEKKKEEEAEDETDACKDGNVVTKEKIVTATKKGSAVLDQWLPDHIKAQYHVLQVGDEIYDAMLNQTNVGFNNNKFYVIQALESDGGGSYMVYSRWGRVGVKGQDDKLGPYTSKERAIREFEQKFFSKTKNYWSNRKEFICRPKSYTWLEMDYSKNEKELSVNEKRGSTSEVQPRETKLEPRIAKFISLISNMNMMKQQMMEIGYNAEKLPLGKLREFVIDTPQKLKSKLEMVEALGEIELATKLLEDVNSIQVSKYAQNTHAKTHSKYTVDIVQIFKLSREGENERFKKFSNTKNRKLLWHGSRLTNWTGILSQGLRIAPPEAPVTGYMFGKGVALGDMVELLDANYDADKLPEGKLSTKGVGQTEPNPSEAGALLYNEYIVYNVDQIRMRYVLQVTFNFKR